jgi:hypothetical protein
MWPGLQHTVGAVPYGTITISSNPMPVLNEWGMGIKEPDKCICDIMALMAVGCKCGQFEREQKSK